MHMRFLVPFAVVSVAFFAAASVWASPARPGVRVHVQPDGTELRIMQFGDEHYHYTMTEDSLLVERDSLGNYVYVDEEGGKSGVRAHDNGFRNQEEKKFIGKLRHDKVRRVHRERRGGELRKRMERAREREGGRAMPRKAVGSQSSVKGSDAAVDVPPVKSMPQINVFTKGERWFPVILLSTPDKEGWDSTTFYRLFNEKGYSDDGKIGSVRDYFVQSSNGMFSPHFDIFPIKLSHSLSYFSKNGNLQEDVFTKEAVDLLAKHPLFGSKYCTKDNVVDGFILLYPGTAEEAMAYAELFWPHQYMMRYNGAGSWSYRNGYQGYKSNGYTFDSYLMAGQVDDYASRKRNTPNIIGTYIHEFSHVLGLADLYSEANGQSINGPGAFDVMSTGMYNGSGNIPPRFSSFEMQSMGWISPVELTSRDSVLLLPDLGQGIVYSVTNPKHKDEFYLVEYRPPFGFDAGLAQGAAEACNGVFVWYVSYVDSLWSANSPISASGEYLQIRDVLLEQRKMSWFNQNTTQKTSFYPFEFANVVKSAEIPGVYNFVSGGDSLTCFTLSQDVQVSECVMPKSSSSEASSSSAVPQSSSSSLTVPESSSSISWTSSSSVAETSSSGVVAIAGAGVASRVGFWLDGRALEVASDAYEKRSVTVLDVQGNVVRKTDFAGSVRMEFTTPGVYVVRVSGENRTLEMRRIVIK